MSCSGCRVLRKGCSESCALRQCLRPIQGGDAQAHATVFVAKFFGRAAMMTFINAVSESHRPELFQSLLYEACGRTVNPVNGAIGLLCSGNWLACQVAVQTVLNGGSPHPQSPQATDDDREITASSLYFPANMPPSLWPPEGLSTDLCGSPRAGGQVGCQQGITRGVTPQSPSGSIFHPLPLKRKHHWNVQCEPKHKLLDCQSLSAGSTGEHQKKINKGVDENQQQQKDRHVNGSKSTKLLVSKQEQRSEQQQQQEQHFCEENVNDQCLELTLSTNPCCSLNPPSKCPTSGPRRPSNPSCVSIESEGSVSSLDSTQISKTRSINPHKKILDLLR